MMDDLERVAFGEVVHDAIRMRAALATLDLPERRMVSALLTAASQRMAAWADAAGPTSAEWTTARQRQVERICDMFEEDPALVPLLLMFLGKTATMQRYRGIEDAAETGGASGGGTGRSHEPID